MKFPHFKSPISQALLLASLFSVTWLYLHCVVQFLLFRFLLPSPFGDTDFGLYTTIPGWVLAFVVGLWVSGPISKRVLGCRSWAGTIASAIMSVPAAHVLFMVFSFVFFKHYSANGQVLNDGPSYWCARLFYFVGFFGLLPEGRPETASLQGFFVLVLFLSSFIGFSITTWRAKSQTVLSAIILCVFGLSQCARAYDKQTHRDLLTGEALSLLRGSSSAKFLELDYFRTTIAQGSVDEDGDAGIRGPFHFFDPVNDAKPWWTKGVSARDVLLGLNPEVIDLYHAGDKAPAYYMLGRIVHLAAQDMFCVPHVFFDAHLPFGGARDSYEEWVELNRYQIYRNATYHGATVPSYSWPPSTVLEENAAYTYAHAKISGTLSQDQITPASPSLLEMFPVNHQYALSYSVLPIDGPEGPEWQGVWAISNYGQCRERSGAIGIPTVGENWWVVGSGVYFEKPAKLIPAKYGGQNNTRTFAEIWALDPANRLIAKSEEATAGILRSFALSVDQKKPAVVMHRDSGEGPIIHPDETTDAKDVFFEIADPVDATFPTASGLYRISVVQTYGGTFSQSIDLAGQNDVIQPFFSLKKGQYTANVYDGLGNMTAVQFAVSGNSCGQSGTEACDDNPHKKDPKCYQSPCRKDGDSAGTGEGGWLCAESSADLVAARRIQNGLTREFQIAVPKEEFCVDWACADPGNYDITVAFQNSKETWGADQTIHCVDQTPQCKVCDGADCASTDCPMSNPQNSKLTTEVDEKWLVGGGLWTLESSKAVRWDDRGGRFW